ncbi:hypothetical protein [Paraburkholderia sp.]|uniref:hypothetical protein n=1 Tax=Paraburkholderia sp. TaxID=1926495 RepID=UPI003D6E7980
MQQTDFRWLAKGFRRYVPSSPPFVKICGIFLFFWASLFSVAAQSFESDVHFGLTKWLAEKAGFTEEESDAIALGDQRVDGGLMENMKSQLQYACLSSFTDDALEVQSLHYPSATMVPARPEMRRVDAGGAAARTQAEKIIKTSAAEAAFMLQLFGRALHSLQDSWSHQGVSSEFRDKDVGLACNQDLALNPPAKRGDPRSHRSELTQFWPDDVKAMASATYAYLLKYPDIDKRKRHPADWNAVSSEMDSFSYADTKSAKATWFKQHSIDDISFLDAISLPDGARWTPVRWRGAKLPALTTNVSTQAGVSQEALDFYNAFFTVWLTAKPGTYAWEKYIQTSKNQHRGLTNVDKSIASDTTLQLRLWRLRDHGSALPFTCSTKGEGLAGQKAAMRLIKKPGSIAQYANIAEALFPLLLEGVAPSPLLPFVVYALKPSQDGDARSIALVKLRDAPYDTLGLVAKQTKGSWHIVQLISTPDY